MEIVLCIAELVIMLICIFIGARLGGLGLGAAGGIGMVIFLFCFHMQPGEIPIDVMLIIASVIAAASCLQASKGMDFLVYLATKLLRKNPKHITFMAPFVTYLFTFCAGTGHVAYALLPIIAEVSYENGVRPERPMSIAVIASQQAITACPISAATVALLTVLTPMGVGLPQILMIAVPATVIGCGVGALVMSRWGKELPDDPEYKRRLEEGLEPIKKDTNNEFVPTRENKLAVVFFLGGAILIVLAGIFPEMRPAWEIDGELTRLSMTNTIEIIMLTVAALMLLVCKAEANECARGSVFQSGMGAVVAVFGVAWMGDTFFKNNSELIIGGLESIVQPAPWLFAVALFLLSILMYSQAATTKTLMPVGVALGLAPGTLIGMFPAVNGYFFIPSYPTVVAAINFDRTGTTRIGKYLLNHSFMVPGLTSTIVAVAIGMVIGPMIVG